MNINQYSNIDEHTNIRIYKKTFSCTVMASVNLLLTQENGNIFDYSAINW